MDTFNLGSLKWLAPVAFHTFYGKPIKDGFIPINIYSKIAFVDYAILLQSISYANHLYQMMKNLLIFLKIEKNK